MQLATLIRPVELRTTYIQTIQQTKLSNAYTKSCQLDSQKALCKFV